MFKRFTAWYCQGRTPKGRWLPVESGTLQIAPIEACHEDSVAGTLTPAGEGYVEIRWESDRTEKLLNVHVNIKQAKELGAALMKMADALDAAETMVELQKLLVESQKR